MFTGIKSKGEILSLLCSLNFGCDLFITQWTLEYAIRIYFPDAGSAADHSKAHAWEKSVWGDQFYLMVIPKDKGL